MPISELSHRGKPDQRESPGKNPELLVGKAGELWRLIAPGREPDSKLPASVSFILAEMLSSTPQSPEVELFNSILEPYLLSKNSRDMFRLILTINPAWYHHPEKNSSFLGGASFLINIFAPPWLSSPVPPVMSIWETPSRKGVLGFAAKDYDTTVKKEKKPLSGIYQQVKPISHLNDDELKQRKLYIVDYKNTGSFPERSVQWRKNFVSEVIDRFIAMAKETPPEQAAQRDRGWQELTRATATNPRH